VSSLLKGSLLLVVSDNLAAHSIGGFFESFYLADSALQVDLPYKQNVCVILLTFVHQIQRIAKNSALQKVYGLKKMSCLNSIPNFHVTPGLPSDVMLDLYERCVCDVIEYVVTYYVECNIISLEYLNEQIVAAFYGC